MKKVLPNGGDLAFDLIKKCPPRQDEPLLDDYRAVWINASPDLYDRIKALPGEAYATLLGHAFEDSVARRNFHLALHILQTQGRQERHLLELLQEKIADHKKWLDQGRKMPSPEQSRLFNECEQLIKKSIDVYELERLIKEYPEYAARLLDSVRDSQPVFIPH